MIRPLELSQGKSNHVLICLASHTEALIPIHSFRASSILQGNTKLYGPMNALNTSEGSSCWNSDACEDDQQQFLLLDFRRSVKVHSLKIEFQAGFIAETCHVKLQTSDNEWINLKELEPEDTHDIQTFSLVEDDEPSTGTALKLVFGEFTDFYGRVTIYTIEAWGQEVS